MPSVHPLVAVILTTAAGSLLASAFPAQRQDRSPTDRLDAVMEPHVQARCGVAKLDQAERDELATVLESHAATLRALAEHTELAASAYHCLQRAGWQECVVHGRMAPPNARIEDVGTVLCIETR